MLFSDLIFMGRGLQDVTRAAHASIPSLLSGVVSLASQVDPASKKKYRGIGLKYRRVFESFGSVFPKKERTLLLSVSSRNCFTDHSTWLYLEVVDCNLTSLSSNWDHG